MSTDPRPRETMATEQRSDRAAAMGHNQGPPLYNVNSWTGYSWKKAYQAVWKTPPIEVVRSRTRRARQLGLTYREYTSVILDRGTHPHALFFGLGGILDKRTSPAPIAPLPSVIDKFSSLANCLVFVVSNPADTKWASTKASQLHSLVQGINQNCGQIITDYRWATAPLAPQAPITAAETRPRFNPSLVLDLLAAHKLPPSAALMIGDSHDDRECAEAASLAKFIWAQDYFSRPRI